MLHRNAGILQADGVLPAQGLHRHDTELQPRVHRAGGRDKGATAPRHGAHRAGVQGGRGPAGGNVPQVVRQRSKVPADVGRLGGDLQARSQLLCHDKDRIRQHDSGHCRPHGGRRQEPDTRCRGVRLAHRPQVPPARVRLWGAVLPPRQQSAGCLRQERGGGAHHPDSDRRRQQAAHKDAGRQHARHAPAGVHLPGHRVQGEVRGADHRREPEAPHCRGPRARGEEGHCSGQRRPHPRRAAAVWPAVHLPLAGPWGVP
mmetsp:Transcript_5629/g.14429  ORF Transcript_5629/g.14429 Transcript_5629/m.14429 type:complete len:258 (+) Transcript_5629:393-1166(+)